MATDKQPTCAERWLAHKRSRITALRTLWLAYREGDHEDLYDYGLSFDYVAPGTFRDQNEGYWRYQLSWGGPSDEFRFYASTPHSTPYRIEYVFMDWGDGEAKALRGKDLELLLALWTWFEEPGTTQSTYDAALKD